MSDGGETDPASRREPPGEVRLAVSMNGGVSLAVWMGGVTSELLELIRSSDVDVGDDVGQGYRQLLTTLDQAVRVDIIAGASAGGINGVLLGLAVARGLRDLSLARAVWLDQGDLDRLVRSPARRDVPSLLDGELFRRSLEDAFVQLCETSVAPTDEVRDAADALRSDHAHHLARAQDKVWVELTLTVLDGMRTAYADDSGTFVVDTDYEATLWFDEEHFRNQDNMAAIATAARASASFPVAFEPVELDVEDRDGNLLRTQLRPSPPADCKRLWVVDGGTLNNKPIDRVLKRIFAQEAKGPVRRLVLHVVPDPGSDITTPTSAKTASEGQGEADDASPSLVSVLWKSLVAMPRNESVRSEIEWIEENNRRAANFSTFRWTLAASLTPPADIEAESIAEERDRLVQVARPMFTSYRQTASRRSATDSWRRVRAQLGDTADASKRERLATIDEDAIVDALARKRADLFPEDYFAATPLARIRRPTDGDGDGFWGYGLDSARRVAATVIDLIQGVAGATTPVPQTAEHIQALFAIQAEVHQQLDVILEVRTSRQHHARLLELLLDNELTPAQIDGWAGEFYDTWKATNSRGQEWDERTAFRRVGQATVKCGELLRRAAPHVDAIAEWFRASAAGDHRKAHVAELATATHTLTWWTPEMTDDTDDEFTAADWTVRQLLAIEMLYSLGAAEDMVPQQVELGQISAFARDHLALAKGNTHRTSPGDKLTGVRAAHFAAFYRRSWRANDWMWGRLDAADRLTVAILDRDQLTRSWMQRTPHDLHQHLKSIATSTRPGHEQLGDDLARRWDRMFAPEWTQGTRLSAELSGITAGGELQDPGILDEVRNAIALRRQAEIVVEEVPLVATQLRRDLADAGTAPNGSQQEFLEKADDLCAELQTDRGGPNLETIAAALDACKIGAETIGDDIGSDRFAIVGGRSVATLSNLVQTAVPWKSVRRITASARGAGLSVHALATLTAQRGTLKSGSAATLLLAVFAAAGATYAASFIVGDGGAVLATIAAILLAAASFVLVRETGMWRFTLLMIVALTLPAIVWNLDETPWADSSLVAWTEGRRSQLAVLTAIVAFTLLGLVSIGHIDSRAAKIRTSLVRRFENRTNRE